MQRTGALIARSTANDSRQAGLPVEALSVSAQGVRPYGAFCAERMIVLVGSPELTRSHEEA
jgi:hypothetical protein